MPVYSPSISSCLCFHVLVAFTYVKGEEDDDEDDD